MNNELNCGTDKNITIQSRINDAMEESMDLTYALAISTGASPVELARALRDNDKLIEFSGLFVKEYLDLETKCDNCRPTNSATVVNNNAKVPKTKVPKTKVPKTKVPKTKSRK